MNIDSCNIGRSGRVSASHRRAIGLRPAPRPESRPFGGYPSRLRACGAARFACLQGESPAGAPRRAWLGAPRYHRTGNAGSARDGAPPHGQCQVGTLGLAAAGCANACRPRRCGGSLPVCHEGWFTDMPPGLAKAHPHRASSMAACMRWGVFSLFVGERPRQGQGACRCNLRAGMPSWPCLLSDWGWFGPRSPCLAVNPGGGTGFMSATFRPQ